MCYNEISIFGQNERTFVPRVQIHLTKSISLTHRQLLQRFVSQPNILTIISKSNGIPLAETKNGK